MVDIFFELPDDLIRGCELKAALTRTDVETLVRAAIEASGAGQPPAATSCDLGPIENEPIVKAAVIEKECRRLGYDLGWRFITCPQGRMVTSKLLLVGLNPGGRAVHGPSWSQEEGSAYCVESWNGCRPGQAPLQRQVQQMLALLGLREDEVFSANFIPFRSPDWRALDRKYEAETFAVDLWRWLLPQVAFDRIVCIGKDKPGKAIARLIDARFEVSLPVDWGSITADRYRLPDGRPLIALPHLSRFAIFGRAEAVEVLTELFDA